MEAIPPVKAAIVHCEQVGDFGSRRLFTDVLQSEEQHVDWLETQLALIVRTGEQNYLQTKIDGDDRPRTRLAGATPRTALASGGRKGAGAQPRPAANAPGSSGRIGCAALGRAQLLADALELVGHQRHRDRGAFERLLPRAH